MARPPLNDLAAFATVARCRSFTAAAAEIGVSPSALSHAMRGLEARLGVRLLARTTRSVAATEAGRRLLDQLGPALNQIETGLAALSDWRDSPEGVVRLTTFHWVASNFLAQRLPGFLSAHPGIRVEVTVDDGFQDIVANGFDAGLRFREDVEKDMIAVRVGPPLRHIVVATPTYWNAHGRPAHPRDLRNHSCVGYHNLTSGTIMPWEFTQGGRDLRQRVDGPLTCNSVDLAMAVVLLGETVGLFMEDDVREALSCGMLEQVLDDWCPPFDGVHLYHPARRQTPPALRHLIDFLRSNADG
ncbi:LysR family transcriptional regulator [Paracoccus laeviglucosivorans]|uniref:DNA-binding transcriptional regulator, LysR family n=1 Tax=Paracoccus laeviglucosivorans TaxID=1197861 RepID=A0A521BVF8_9RHOB|nr:LysR family transcriptional regulator [Paracoccus laeviglucosivorans]SMO51177.1 DNA-binding transcriptional regulator, LysR family [Paracoccus laeviglucosivorans]